MLLSEDRMPDYEAADYSEEELEEQVRHTSLLEFYLFVNPLGLTCYHSDQELLNALERVSTHYNVNVLCYHNQATLSRFIERLGLNPCSLKLRNEIFEKIYLASLASKAASLQGKRFSRQFITQLQNKVNNEIDRFNLQLIMEIAEALRLDLDSFEQDLHSDIVKKLFTRDQQTANDMNVQQTPSLVIFEYMSDEDGIVLNHEINRSTILREIHRVMASLPESNLNDLNNYIQVVK